MWYSGIDQHKRDSVSQPTGRTACASNKSEWRTRPSWCYAVRASRCLGGQLDELSEQKTQHLPDPGVRTV
jgi:hypothetical protein